MKRAVLLGAAVLAAFALPGCPVYPQDRECFSHDDCPIGAACHSAGYCVIVGGKGGSSAGGQCDEPSDCKANETCGEDRRCHEGSCRFHRCVSGFECGRLNGVHACVPATDAGGAGGSSGSGGDADVDGVAGSSGSDAGADADEDTGAEDSGDDGPEDAPADSDSCRIPPCPPLDAADDSAPGTPADAARDVARD